MAETAIARTSANFASKDEVRTIVKVFSDLTGRTKHDPLRHFKFPTGLNTVCTVSFDGPVTIDDFDALLAHVAFYKTFLKKGVMDNDGYLSKSGMVSAIIEALERLPPSPAQGVET